MGLFPRLSKGTEQAEGSAETDSGMPEAVELAFNHVTSLDSRVKLEAALVLEEHLGRELVQRRIESLIAELDTAADNEEEITEIGRASYMAIMDLAVHGPADSSTSEPPAEMPVELKDVA